MAVRCLGQKRGASWSIEDIPYEVLAPRRCSVDQRLFYSLLPPPLSKSRRSSTRATWSTTSAATVRSSNGWSGSWEIEERQHGAALKRYVQTAWPDFDWEAAYRNFFADYSRLCTIEQLAGTRALEMAARCVVETGTATFYRMLSQTSDEPVLRISQPRSAPTKSVTTSTSTAIFGVTRRWSNRAARPCCARSGTARPRSKSEDAFCAFRALYLARNPEPGSAGVTTRPAARTSGGSRRITSRTKPPSRCC